MKKMRQVPVRWAELIRQLQEVVFPKGGFLPDSRGNYMREQKLGDGGLRQSRFRFGVLGFRKEVRTYRHGSWGLWHSVGFCYYCKVLLKNGLVETWSWERNGPRT